MTSRSNTVSAEHWESLKEQYRSRLARGIRARQLAASIHDGTFGTAPADDDRAQ